MNGREIVVGVTGGIAAYKTAHLVSRLVQAGAGVSVVMTGAATELVAPATFQALSGRPVATNVFSPLNPMRGAHIELAKGDVLCVAPATANFLAKAAVGIADDLLSTLYLSFMGAVLVAPAMNCEMWAKPAVARNVRRLCEDGVQMVGPEDGWLACGTRGPGRMSEPESIYAAIEKLLGERQ